ncbi:MAG: hypothetical protein Q4B14_00070 [Clostridia bacterium]|nr:hypothetical protein [Clostridia bacterium]
MDMSLGELYCQMYYENKRKEKPLGEDDILSKNIQEILDINLNEINSISDACGEERKTDILNNVADLFYDLMALLVKLDIPIERFDKEILNRLKYRQHLLEKNGFSKYKYDVWAMNRFEKTTKYLKK